MKVDTTAIEQEIAAYEKQLRQHYSTKSRLMEEIDSLDPDDRHFIARKSDLDDRLYKMYDKIEEVENGLMDARAKKQAIEADKITGDNIYKILICFDKFYATMTEAERRRLVEILIDEVQIYPERQPNGQWLKAVRFKLPIIDHDLELSLDNQDRVEVVDALIPQRQQLLCSILAAAAAAAVDQQRRLLIGQRLGHFAPDALVGHKDGVFNMPAIVFLPGADIHHHDLLRDHHLIGFLGADLMIRRLAGSRKKTILWRRSIMNAKVSKLINEQINKEFYSAYLYLDFANYYAAAGLDGFENWYRVQAQEERDHAMLFYQYLQNNGEGVTFEAIAKPEWERGDHMTPLKKALEHEKLVTASINAIYAAAYEVKDFRTMQMLDWFIKEQGEEEKNAADLITKMDLFGGDSKGLYMLNSELKARVYTAPSLVL